VKKTLKHKKKINELMDQEFDKFEKSQNLFEKNTIDFLKEKGLFEEYVDKMNEKSEDKYFIFKN